MSALPKIDEANRKKPLCYDPKRNRFIYYDELISESEKVIMLENLTKDQLKKLIVERNRAGSDYTVGTLNGEKFNRDDVVKAIIEDTDFGKMAMDAEVSHLSDLLKQIKRELEK